MYEYNDTQPTEDFHNYKFGLKSDYQYPYSNIADYRLLQIAQRVDSVVLKMVAYGQINDRENNRQTMNRIHLLNNREQNDQHNFDMDCKFEIA